ncbi:hypothetical protein, partial [Cronobacter sakazakii]|uniref:hypothetical protein n=1 Tax=Cronobacter sakazakii TaxID=28141 RepID=UPI001C4D95FD
TPPLQAAFFYFFFSVFTATRYAFPCLTGARYRSDSPYLSFDFEGFLARFSRSCDRENHSVDLCLPGQ